MKRAFGKFHKDGLKITDSQVVLYWVHNKKKPLSQWVRNRVIEIQRFIDPSLWMYTQSSNMITDIGTRRVKSLAMVDQNSYWINGHAWMKKHGNCFPFKSIDDIRFSKGELNVLRDESLSYDKSWIDNISERDGLSDEVYSNSCNAATDFQYEDNNLSDKVVTC